MSQFSAGKMPEKEQELVVEDAVGRGMQGAVGELGFASGEHVAAEGVPDPELVEKASRRRYSAKYKLSIVREADACTKPGEVGALLRREGLYSSHLGTWRAQRDAGGSHRSCDPGLGAELPEAQSNILGGFNRSSQRLREEVAMGRPAGWMKELTGRSEMKSPGAPSLRRDVERLFWHEVAKGLSSEEAALAVGASQAAGSRWFRERGGMPTFMLVELCGRYLGFEEREEIALLRAQGAGVRSIARRLGRSPSTISRELRRNAWREA